jgi:Co/Zn/Cd efflux system component
MLVFCLKELAIDAIKRIHSPKVINGQGMLIVSLLGGLVNLMGVILTHKEALKLCPKKKPTLPGTADLDGPGLPDTENSGLKVNPADQVERISGEDEDGVNLNVVGLFLHMLADTIGRLVAIISSIIVIYWDSHIVDPIGTLISVTVISVSLIPTLAQCTKILCLGLEPKDSSLVGELRKKIRALDFVKSCNVYMWRSDSDTRRVNIELDISYLERKDIDGIIEFRNRVRQICLEQKIREKELLIDINYIDYHPSNDSD